MMLALLILAAALWLIGGALGVAREKRALVLWGLLFLVLLMHFLLPDGHPVREATGGGPGPWFLLLVAGFAVAGYRRLLAVLRARAARNAPAEPAPDPRKFTEGELQRYARHIVLREFGGPGQQRLKAARVLVIGAGGLGSPALLYLGAAGVGTLGIVDDDRVSVANLQRQVIHMDDAIEMPKVFSAEETLNALNPRTHIRPWNRRLTEENAEAILAEHDVILDGSDNFETRYLVNRTAARLGLPLISGALAQWEGQLSVFDPARGGPCYQCVFPQAPAPHLAPSCAEAGVIGPLPGVIGTMMAVETIKVLADIGQPLRGEMLIYDALWGETRKIALKKRPDCPVCGG